MMSSIPVIRKKRGRPETGVDPMLTFRAPSELIGRIELWGVQRGVATRSEAIRQLVEKGLGGVEEPWSDGDAPAARPIGSEDLSG
jgi:hypothetical protein